MTAVVASSELTAKSQVYLDTAKLLHRQCVAVESCLESLEGVIFPVRMGNPPNKTPGRY